MTQRGIGWVSLRTAAFGAAVTRDLPLGSPPSSDVVQDYVDTVCVGSQGEDQLVGAARGSGREEDGR